MAVINLASQIHKSVLERLSFDALTGNLFNKSLDVSFNGVKSVSFYSVGTAPINDYSRSGTSRYGTPTELDDFLQEMTMTQDKSSTWTIDKGNQKEQFNIKKAQETLKRQIKEKYAPMIDKYRFSRWLNGAGQVNALSAAPTKSTIVSSMVKMHYALTGKAVPVRGRTYIVPIGQIDKVVLADEFHYSDALTTKILSNGEIGTFLGVPLKPVPDDYLPSGVYFACTYKPACISPVKLQDYKINTTPQGVSGDLVEMRLIYDAFVDGTKADGIYVAASADVCCAAPTVEIASNTATMTSTTSGATILYTVDGSDPRYSKSALTYNASAKPTIEAGATVRACATKSGSFQSGVAAAVNA